MSRRNFYDVFFLPMHFKGVDEICEKLQKIGKNGYYIRKTNSMYLTCTKELGQYDYIFDYYIDDGNGFNDAIDLDDMVYLGRSKNIMIWRRKNNISDNKTFLSEDKKGYYNQKILKKDVRTLAFGIMFSILSIVMTIFFLMTKSNFDIVTLLAILLSIGLSIFDVWLFKTIKVLMNNNS